MEKREIMTDPEFIEKINILDLKDIYDLISYKYDICYVQGVGIVTGRFKVTVLDVLKQISEVK